MPLVPGTRLGPYEILSALGAGGMGEVFKARDTRLDRTVAVKILPDALAADPQFRERFDREARAISQLTHPHICTLYDVGEHPSTGSGQATAFLVMELLDGETLADRLTKGALPPTQAMAIAIEVVSALDAAHRAGIVHRDLKPGNVMLTKSGAKLLDFGLAKTNVSAVTGGGTMAPTTPASVTAQGTILGTFQYMAPEQIEGLDADARTDLFAFGCVLFEMLTGKKAFEGKTRASLIGAILKDEPPPVSQVQPVAPAALNHIVARCLAKDPVDRWQTARDLMHELQWIANTASQAGALAPVVAQRRGRERLAWMFLAGVLVLMTLGLGAVAYLRQAPSDARLLRFFVSPPEGSSLALTVSMSGGASLAPLAVSPDGRRLAFIARGADGKQLLWIRALDTLTTQVLAGTDGVSSPFWSPDSKVLGFFADGKLKKIEVSGGPPVTLCDAPTTFGGTWSRDGVIVFSLGAGGLQKVSAAGGVPAAVATGVKGEAQWRPSFLPDGRHFLYRVTPPSPGGPIYIGSLDSSDRTKLLDADSTNAPYSQGHILFLRDKTLMAQPFDARRLALSGEPFPVAEQIQTLANNPTGVFSVSDTGVLAYLTGAAGVEPRLVWLNRSGAQVGTLGDPGRYSDLQLSPDRLRAAVSLPDGSATTRDLWIFDVARGLRTRFTFDPADEQSLVWSPDGSRIVFNSRRKGHLDLYQKASSGAGAEEVLLADNLEKAPVSWSPDGRFILYTVAGGSTGVDLWILPLSGDRKPFPFLQTPFNELPGVFSPDGRWIAYVSNESGRVEVYVAPFPGPGGKWMVSTAGGNSPRWRSDGKEIFYLAGGQQLMAAAVDGAGSSFQGGAVQPLFAIRPLTARSFYDVSADGQRFLAIAAPDLRPASTPPITVVVNWTAGLKK